MECMISVLYNLGLCSDMGIVKNGTEAEACRLFNIHFSDVTYHYPIETIYSDGSLLIGTTKLSLHCVRYWAQKEEAKIIVMDPEDGEFKYWDRENLEGMAPRFHRIELMRRKIT